MEAGLGWGEEVWPIFPQICCVHTILINAYIV